MILNIRKFWGIKPRAVRHLELAQPHARAVEVSVPSIVNDFSAWWPAPTRTRSRPADTIRED